jgi:hypothetical protein
MIEIPLQAIPNQSLSILLGESQWDIRIKAAGNIMAFDISENNVPIVTGQRAVAGYPIIPYEYLEDGNFVLLTMNDEYPDYTQFGVTQSLIYTSETELETFRAATGT